MSGMSGMSEMAGMAGMAGMTGMAGMAGMVGMQQQMGMMQYPPFMMQPGGPSAGGGMDGANTMSMGMGGDVGDVAVGKKRIGKYIGKHTQHKKMQSSGIDMGISDPKRRKITKQRSLKHHCK